MNVFVAGATGAIGRPLVAQLLAAGHRVVGTTRSASKAKRLEAAGAEAVVVDALDGEVLRTAILAASPDVVLHQLTDLSTPMSAGAYESWVAGTDRLRREVTPTLVAAAREAGARRVIAQSVSFMTAPEGPAVLDETAPLYLPAPAPLTGTITAQAVLEDEVTSAEGVEGVVLRYGFFYGPGTSWAPDGEIVDLVRAGEYPIVGSGDGRYAFIHVDDAAAATVLALRAGDPGIYNIVDDEPAAMREWVPYLAELVGAPAPPTVPASEAARDVGEQIVYYGTRMRGASNAKARAGLGFEPRYRSWREGFRATFGPPAEV